MTEGHEFEISIRVRGDGCDWWGDLMTQTVRAWNLREALEAAAEVPLSEWLAELLAAEGLIDTDPTDPTDPRRNDVVPYDGL